MIEIRKMIAEDRTAVSRILEQTDMFTAAELDVALELIDIYLTNNEQKDYIIYVATNERKEVVGYVCYGPTPATDGTFDLYWIAVSPAMQQQGVGKALLNFTEQQVMLHNGRMIIIETSSQPKYKPTQDFYLRNRYQIEARIKDFYRVGDDRLIFVKRLK
ncbi:MAG: GNAT family N-acetyltransferase [candidate division KSB1 bacterium]|nr:GNAT family N-acetyltransferase [candidate division KSB1 bacterium]MDZ7335459.1 GNAT family N-acetyltransferase [candidate division KSB1 bacterium]MDZ7358763.1 GNAT family N-acetyltransferase [candidate division KSB1 bacterium]MDZ7400297.1 GNAT family N-acetyltransferase [candidate division KSB1 bacterium]